MYDYLVCAQDLACILYVAPPQLEPQSIKCSTTYFQNHTDGQTEHEIDSRVHTRMQGRPNNSETLTKEIPEDTAAKLLGSVSPGA